MTKAVITGVSGQDGSYLAELLLSKGYDVVGVVRRSANEDLSRLEDARKNPKLKLVYGDISEPSFIANLIEIHQPEEFYNLAAQSFVAYSFENPATTFEVNAIAVTHMLAAIERYSPKTKFYQASTSEMFGGFNNTAPQHELTYFKPQSPYGIAKLAAHNMVRLARDRGVFACAGILFNHESERRGKEFVTQKICEQAVEVWMKKREYITLGWLGAKRDWGYAPEYVEGMWKMLQHPRPDDYVLATGVTYTVETFLMWICEALNLPLVVDSRVLLGNGDASVYMRDPRFERPNEVNLLVGNASKAHQELNWKAKTMGKTLALTMLHAVLNRQPLGAAKELAGSLMFNHGRELANAESA